MHKCEIDIFWRAEAGCSPRGRAYKEALAEAEIAMASWLAVAREKGRLVQEVAG